VNTTKKSLASIAWGDSEQRSRQRWLGSGYAAGALPQILLRRAGETRIPSFNFNSLAMCSLPQVGLSAAMSRINCWILGQSGSSDRLGLPAPEQAEQSAIPSDQHVRLHHYQCATVELLLIFCCES
jgi:hypothetical protein